MTDDLFKTGDAAIDAPVLIAGAGPVGLVLALELAYHGVRSILIDREPEATRFPKMDITNGRSMELFRRLGISGRVRAAGVAPEFSFDVLWALPDGSPPYGRWDLPGAGEQQRRIDARNDGSMPLEADVRIPQSGFEAIARIVCREEPLIDFREGVTFSALEQDPAGVDVSIEEVASGRREVCRVAYLVGCDGAGSQVRRQLGIALEAKPDMPKNFMVHFRSTDLPTLHRYGQFWHYFVAGSVLIAQDEVDHWTFHGPLFEGVPEVEPDPAAFLADRLGWCPQIDEVLLTSIWQPRFALAERYGDGRVFLAGDAVHQVFPTGGYGMNTGVGDAVDLGWKLAAVVNGWGGVRLLDSYEAERRPVGATNRDYAFRNVGIHIGTVERIRSGAPVSALKDFVENGRGENEYDGIEFGYRYNGSPVIAREQGDPPRWSEWDYIPSTWPGARAPSMILSDGRALFDRLGPELTLVDFTGRGGSLVEAANKSGIPVVHLPIDEAAVRAVWEKDYVLVRPDHHVAWRADRLPDEAQWQSILDLVCGVPNQDGDQGFARSLTKESEDAEG